MARARRITPVKFPLASSAARIALFTNLMERPRLARQAVEEAILADTAPRPHTKPIVADGRRFPSVNDAARWLYANRPGLRGRAVKAPATDMHAAIGRIARRIAKWADADCYKGYYWTE